MSRSSPTSRRAPDRGRLGRRGGIMTPERWHRVKQLFEAALEQDGASRSGFVAQAAADDSAVAEQVLRLLSSDERAGSFLDVPAGLSTPDVAESAPAAAAAGRRIGPYRVQGEIGHGGMGTVYRAV